MKKTLLFALLSCAFTLNAHADASSYPERPVSIVVPVSAGGNADAVARLLAGKISPILGTKMVVENRTGAGGAIGAEYVARAKPDGYTLLTGSNGQLAANPAVNPKLSYDPIKDFAPIGLVYRVPLALTVGANSPIKTLQQFIDQSKQSATGLTIGTSGTGGAQHLMAELFAGQTGAKLLMVPYRGGGAIIPDLIAGEIDGTLNELPNVMNLHRENKVRILAISSAERSELLPDLPTFREAGAPDYVAYSTGGWLAPAGTPGPVLDKLQAALATALTDAEVKERFAGMGLSIADPADVDQKRFGQLIADELARSQKVAAEHNIVLQ